jgi:uncharacterized membrane protein
MTAFLDQYEHILHFVAELLAYTLELVGILIIVVGSFRALVRLIRNFRSRGQFNVVIDLGRALALALEFKMGAEIIKTVIIHDIMELITLAIVILIRALLAVIIHWEIKMERRDEITKSLDDIAAMSDKNTKKK